MSERVTYHFEKLMTLVQMGHDDSLALWYRPISADEFAVFDHAVYLEKGELVLGKVSMRKWLRSGWTYGVELSRMERSTVSEDLIQHLFYC